MGGGGYRPARWQGPLDPEPGFPVRDTTGLVSWIVGVAEDLTKKAIGGPASPIAEDAGDRAASGAGRPGPAPASRP